jgi:ATP phosphoribosyltransferase
LDVVELPEATRAKTIARWVLDHNIRVVNIAGTRESLLRPAQLERVKAEVDHALRVMAFCRVQCTDLGIETIVSRIPSEMPHRTGIHYGGLRVAIAKATNTQKLFYRFAKDVLGVPTPSLRKLSWSDQCAGLETFFARARELPILLRDGQVDLILCGTDIFDEFHPEVRVLLNTGLEPCSMVLVGRTDRVDGEPSICSQYPNLAPRLLQNFGCCQVKVREIAGAAEAWIAMGAFDFAVDTWRTGLTADVNGMRLIRTFYPTHLAFGASVDHELSSAQALFLEDFREWVLR